MNKKIFLAAVFLLLGFFILAYTFYPLISWYFIYLPKIESQNIISPLTQAPQSQPKGWMKENIRGNQFLLKEKGEKFYLSIPRLKIKDAEVKIESRDFLSSLAQHPGSALPGERGNIFISGHSVLPQFYNPKNYLTIFSTLYELEQGDLLYLSYLGQEYIYKVETLKVVGPEASWVIFPPDPFGKYLTLFTCTPPGLKSSRLVVLAKIQGEEEEI
jgi:sortase A